MTAIKQLLFYTKPTSFLANFGFHFIITAHFGISSSFLMERLNTAKHLYFWSAGPRRPSDESDAIVAGCLHMYLAGWLSGYISMSRRRVPTSFPQWPSHALCNCLVKKINQGTDVLTHNCLPPLLVLCVPV